MIGRRFLRALPYGVGLAACGAYAAWATGDLLGFVVIMGGAPFALWLVRDV